MKMVRWSIFAILLVWACPSFGAGSMVHDWSQSFGVAESQYSNELAVDGQGNVVLAGFFRIAVDFGGGVLTSAGDYDGFVAKFDGAGNHVWSKRFGAATYDEATAVAVDGQGNVILTGLFRGTVDFGGGALTSAGGSDIFVAKYDEAGNHVWSYRFGDFTDDGGHAVAVDSQGNVILIGSFYYTVDFGGGVLTSPENFFIARFGADGTHLWSKSFGDWETQIINRSVAADTQGNVIITGSFLGTVNFGGSAFTSYPGLGHEDYYAAKFDVNGNHVWSNTFWAWGPQRPSSVAVDGQDNVILTGYFQHSVNFGGATLNTPSMFNMDIFVAKFDAGGNHVWSNNFGDASGASPYGNQYAYSGAVDGQGNVIVTGQFFRTLDFGGGVLTNPSGAPAVYVARLDAAGNHLWSKSFGTGNADYEVGRSVTADHQGNVIVTGIYFGTVNFGGTDLTTAGIYDIFLAKFVPGEAPPECAVTPTSLSAELLPGESITQSLTISNLGDLALEFDIASNQLVAAAAITTVSDEVLTPCAYLTVGPTSGTVAGGGTADVDVTFDATGFDPGTYDCELIVFSNAVNINRLVVPLQMIVAQVTQEVTVDIMPAQVSQRGPGHWR